MKRLAHLFSMLLIVAVAVAAIALSQRFSFAADWTFGNRNSLTPASLRVLKTLDAGPIKLTAYIYPGTARADVRAQLDRYTRASPRVQLRFADPARHPDIVRRLGIGSDGAVLVQYQGRSQTVTEYSEASITNALQRLSASGNQWIVFVDGHGERALADKNTSGYSDMAAALDAQGLQTRELSLADAGAVPDNTSVLVIASPQSEYLPGEVALIRRYVAHGGDLLWLDDPGSRYGLVPLAQYLGIHWDHGTVVYPDYRKLGTGHPAMALIANYPDTPITAHLTQLTLLPFAGGLATVGGSNWDAQAFLRSPPRSWLETSPLDGASITFESASGDRAGPIDMGLELSRRTPTGQTDRQQRAVVVADSDFMDNGHLATLGNRTLALSIFQWLAHRDAQIAVDVPSAPDAQLQMSPARVQQFWWLYVVVVPLAMLMLGIGRWWWRRRR